MSNKRDPQNRRRLPLCFFERWKGYLEQTESRESQAGRLHFVRLLGAKVKAKGMDFNFSGGSAESDAHLGSKAGSRMPGSLVGPDRR